MTEPKTLDLDAILARFACQYGQERRDTQYRDLIHARVVIPALVARIRELESSVAALQEALEAYHLVQVDTGARVESALREGFEIYDEFSQEGADDKALKKLEARIAELRGESNGGETRGTRVLIFS